MVLSARQGTRGLGLLTLLRALTLGLALMAIANPAWLRMHSDQKKPRLLLLSDASGSMDLASPGSPTRRQQVQRQFSAASTAQILERFEVVTLPFADGLTNAGGQVTDIAQALRQAAELYQPQDIVVVSDGAETIGAARQAAAALAARGLRVDALGAGSSLPPPDVGPVRLTAPRVVKENQPFPVGLSVAASGLTGAEALQVTLDGKVFARPQVTLAQAPQQVRIQSPGLAAGYHLLTVRAAPRAGEATLTNNERTVLVEARRDKTRFVILAGAPSPEYANLKRVLDGLPKLEFDWHVRMTKGSFAHDVGQRLQRETLNLRQSLANRHVLVLMNLETAALDTASVRDFVSRGGALAVLGGPHSLGSGGYGGSGLASLLPVRATGSDYSDVPVAPGAPNAALPLGRELAQAVPSSWWSAAPFLAGLNRVAASPGGLVIARTRSGLPLLATQTLGQNRTLVVATDATYRWVLSPQADEQSRKLHEVFWQTVVSWLAQPRDDRQVLLMLDPPVAPYGQPVRALVQVSRGLQPVQDAPVTVRLQRPGLLQTISARPTATPGRYQASLGNLDAGTYSVKVEAGSLGSDERKLVVEPGGAELARLTLQEGALREIARAGGGQYAPPGSTTS
ncbi:MAG: glutamine amidotransferase, partial [Armatimonadota bacterium]